MAVTSFILLVMPVCDVDFFLLIFVFKNMFQLSEDDGRYVLDNRYDDNIS